METGWAFAAQPDAEHVFARPAGAPGRGRRETRCDPDAIGSVRLDPPESAGVWVVAQFGVPPLPDGRKDYVAKWHVLECDRVFTDRRPVAENDIGALQTFASRFNRPCPFDVQPSLWRLNGVDVVPVSFQSSVSLPPSHSTCHRPTTSRAEEWSGTHEPQATRAKTVARR